MTETELEYQFCFNCNDRKQCYTKPKDCTRIQEEIGLQEMTNEEWLRQCNMEQLADVLLEHFEWGLSINAEYCFTEKYVEQNREHILEWLKQPHTIKE